MVGDRLQQLKILLREGRDDGLRVYVKHAEAHSDADIPDLKEKVEHIRLSLLHYGQTEEQHIAAHHACVCVVDFLLHRDEDRRLQDVMLALDRLKTAAGH